jgi:hypothetical protein
MGHPRQRSIIWREKFTLKRIGLVSPLAQHRWIVWLMLISVTFPLSPGVIETDMCTYWFKELGPDWFEPDFHVDSGMQTQLDTKVASALKETAITVAQGSKDIIGIIDDAEREKEGGQFVHVDGSRLAW